MATTKQAATFLRMVVAAAGLLCAGMLPVASARAQTLAVLPVNINLAPDQLASTVTVTNQGTTDTAVQVRVYRWTQVDGDDKLTPTEDVLVSPPIATIGPNSSQIIRIVLRKHPAEEEGTYRIILDQIPPPAEPGVVHVVLKLSLPIFAQPTHRTTAEVHFHLEHASGKIFLVATNTGTRHEAVRDIQLASSDGHKLKLLSTMPYVLAGATRRWEIAAPDSSVPADQPLTLTAHEDAEIIHQQVAFADGH